MTPEAAATLARQFANSFPGSSWTGAVLDMWAGDIQHLDDGALGTTIARLRRTWKPTAKQTHPSLAELMAAYRQVDTSTPESHRCDTCDGTGWEPTTIERNGHTYSAVTPCKCPAGTRN